MDDTLLENYKALILNDLCKSADPTAELERILEAFKHPITGKELNSDQKTRLHQEIQEDLNFRLLVNRVEILRPSVLRDPRDHVPWYQDWLSEYKSERYYWKTLEKHLEKKLRLRDSDKQAAEIICSTDISSDQILDDMEAPSRPVFSSKGLVIGYVQSGKTANFTATIAKAVDAGFRFVVVLAGIHDILRMQTQVRLDRELTGINDRGLPRDEFVSIPSNSRAWERLTNASELVRSGEFIIEGKNPFGYYCSRPNPILAVIKKNTRVMEKLIGWISKTSTDDERSLVPLLVVDDEADLASLNTKARTDNEVSRTNACIRELLTLFPRTSHIGYTATPFANFFIDKDAVSGDLYADLYPRNFIHSLPEPHHYFGAAKIFESDISENYVKEITDHQVLLPRRNDPTPIQLPDSLLNAVLTFILGCTVRDLRGDGGEPMSMLVHVSHLTHVQREIARLLSEYVRVMKEVRLSSHQLRNKLFAEFEELWAEYFNDCRLILSSLRLRRYLPDFRDVRERIPHILRKIIVLELNYNSEDKLDYTVEPPPKVIAVGGNKLSRGLTLEGLFCSYFTRNSRQYDSLLQMGRWFGFRSNYEDLPRLFTSPGHAMDFAHLAAVEAEVRNSISLYAEEGVTPENLPVLVRSHRNLKITSLYKMGAATEQRSSFSGSVAQTFKFPLDRPDILKNNLDVTEEFINILSQIKAPEDVKIGSNYIWRDIDPRTVKNEFLDKYIEVDSGLRLEYCLNYIDERMLVGELLRWSVTIISRRDGKTVNWGGLKIKPKRRSRKKYAGYNLGVVDEHQHRKLDLEPHEKKRPADKLLINIYRISKDSTAGPNSDRLDLFHEITTEHLDVVAIALVFPESPNAPAGYFGQIFQ